MDAVPSPEPGAGPTPASGPAAGPAPGPAPAIAQLAALVAARRASTAPDSLLVGIGGGVAVGKSTVAAELAGLLDAHHGLAAAVVSSDGFLHTNAELAALGLAARKGFPESYDTAAIERFVADVRAGRDPLEVPVYDHLLYDVLDQRRSVARSPVVLFEGVNVLHFADRLDLAVYVDAAEPDMRRWFVHRVLQLRTEAADVPGAHLAPVAALDDATVAALAEGVWEAVNLPNLHEAIEPSREHADVVLHKGSDHAVTELRLR